MNESIFPVLLMVAGTLAALLVVIALARKQMRSNRGLAEARRIDRERRRFVIARREEISRALQNTTLRADELERITDTIVAEIASRNDGGCLDAYLADTRGFLAEEVARRATS
jgi:hypothetical protein